MPSAPNLHRALIIAGGIAFCALRATASDAQTPTASPSSAPTARASGAPSAEHVEPAQITISGWRLDCNSVGSTLACQLQDQVTARANNAVITAISIRQDAAGQAPLAIVQIPLGTAVDDAVRLGFDNGAVQRLPVRTCNRNGCFASDRLGEPIVSALKAAKVPLRIAYDTLADGGAKQTVTISLGLDGFATAYARLH